MFLTVRSHVRDLGVDREIWQGVLDVLSRLKLELLSLMLVVAYLHIREVPEHDWVHLTFA